MVSPAPSGNSAFSRPDPLERARETIRLLVAAMDDPRIGRSVEAAGVSMLQARRGDADHVDTQL